MFIEQDCKWWYNILAGDCQASIPGLGKALRTVCDICGNKQIRKNFSFYVTTLQKLVFLFSPNHESSFSI